MAGAPESVGERGAVTGASDAARASSARAGFAASLARARSKARGSSPRILAAPGGRQGAVGLVLARRRGAADAACSRLRTRREDAEPARPGGTAPRLAEAFVAAPADAARGVFPPQALDRLALEARNVAEGSSLELRFGGEVKVCLTRAPAGVSVVLTAPAALRRAAETELPALLAALRARGVPLATTMVRTLVRPPPAVNPGSLTAAERSDTTGPRSSAGTVAKW